MKLSVSGLAVALLSLCTLTLAASAQMHVDYMSAPTTLEGLFSESGAVVLVQVTGRKEVAQFPNSSRTEYGVIVLEKFKGDGSVPAHGPGLTVRRRGGLTQDKAEAGFQPFEPGEQYVLFLKQAPDVGGWTPAYGPTGALRVHPGGKIEPLGEQTVSRAYRGADFASLLQQLRRIAG